MNAGRSTPSGSTASGRSWPGRRSYIGAMLMFLVTGGDQPVLVDSGPLDEDWNRQYHGCLVERPAELEPANVLARHGIEPGDIEIVINTHLHWDHCSNNSLFPERSFTSSGTNWSMPATPCRSTAGPTKGPWPGSRVARRLGPHRAGGRRRRNRTGAQRGTTSRPLARVARGAGGGRRALPDSGRCGEHIRRLGGQRRRRAPGARVNTSLLDCYASLRKSSVWAVKSSRATISAS